MTKQVAENPTPIYYGDNGIQVFYESECGKGLLMKVKGERFWTVLLNGRILTQEVKPGTSRSIGGRIAEKALVELNKHSKGLTFSIDRTKEWIEPTNKTAKRMVLKSVEPELLEEA